MIINDAALLYFATARNLADDLIGHVGGGWFLTLLALISASGPLLSVILSARSKNRLDQSNVGINKATEAELSQKAVSLNEDREAQREQRFLEREEKLESEIQECRDEVDGLRKKLSVLTEYIVEDEDWHFHDNRERRAKGEPLRERVDFETFKLRIEGTKNGTD